MPRKFFGLVIGRTCALLRDSFGGYILREAPVEIVMIRQFQIVGALLTGINQQRKRIQERTYSGFITHRNQRCTRHGGDAGCRQDTPEPRNFGAASHDNRRTRIRRSPVQIVLKKELCYLVRLVLRRTQKVPENSLGKFIRVPRVKQVTIIAEAQERRFLIFTRCGLRFTRRRCIRNNGEPTRDISPGQGDGRIHAVRSLQFFSLQFRENLG